MLPGLFGGRTRKRKMRVSEAMDYLTQEEEQKLIDMDQVTRDRAGARRTQRHHLPRRD
jgi:ATP-dependent HslUV protease ATP-binding subunit HslU